MSISVVSKESQFGDIRPFRWLFRHVNAAWLWLPVRVWLGYQWIEAASHKLTDAAWMVTGEALQGFWARAVAIPAEGRPLITYDWYRSFLQMMLDAQAYTWFAKVVAVGELLIGVGLIVGGFTAVAAFFGFFMNWNFLMAGVASSNPIFIPLEILLILAWRVAGRVGADYFLLRWLARLFNRKASVGGRAGVVERAPAVGD